MRSLALLFAIAPIACGPQVPVDAGDSTGIDDDVTATAPGDDDGDEDHNGESDDDDADESDTDKLDLGDAPEPSGCGDPEDPCPLDILVVVDNSSTMADPQVALTRALVQLVGRLEQHDDLSLAVDVQIMFTTSDMGNTLCEQFQQPDYTPAMGAPITTGCNARIARFTGLGSDPQVRDDVCTDVCPSDLEPTDPFVAFSGTDSANVPDGPALDVDGDGLPDSRAAQAVACLAPQGIDGCGYEQPLETMLQALDPGAPWNNGERPFLRPDSVVMILLATDELDCSMDDPSLVFDEAYWESNPKSALPEPSSALCWNAGIACGEPDADGVYPDCVTTEAPLQPTSRYSNYLLDELEGHKVFMLALTGVPLVTQHNQAPPYQPVAGGVSDLVIRQWRQGPYPTGDIVPQDFEDGVDADDKTWLYKAGPGCTAPVRTTNRFVQAIPNPRVNEVCQSLDDGVQRCCIQSICDPAPSLACIEGWLSHEHPLPPGG